VGNEKGGFLTMETSDKGRTSEFRSKRGQVINEFPISGIQSEGRENYFDSSALSSNEL
jgi:hypothetical protein